MVQAQDPENDPDLFFDPATKATVRKGEQANTFPFGEAGAVTPAPAETEAETSAEVPTQTALPAEEATECVTAVTVTITGTATASSSVPTVTVGGEATATSAAEQPAATAVGDADFGSCSVPQIEFGAGFGGRTETAFQPVDSDSFTQGSAQNIDIITRAICDQLVNTCDANQAALDLCETAKAAASAAEVKTGAQADAFNAVFGIDTVSSLIWPHHYV